jgi:ArsR family transcriptional regulator
MARLLAVLADGTRLRLIRLLLQRELCVCELVDALQMPQYKISRHLRMLRAVALVEARRSGRWMHYRIGRQASTGGLHRDLLAIIRAHLKDMPEAIRDDTRLFRRLCLRQAGRCVVGTGGRGARGGDARAPAGSIGRRLGSRCEGPGKPAGG